MWWKYHITICCSWQVLSSTRPKRACGISFPDLGQHRTFTLKSQLQLSDSDSIQNYSLQLRRSLQIHGWSPYPSLFWTVHWIQSWLCYMVYVQLFWYTKRNIYPWTIGHFLTRCIDYSVTTDIRDTQHSLANWRCFSVLHFFHSHFSFYHNSIRYHHILFSCDVL